MSFNPEYLLAPLKNLSTAKFYLDVIDEMSPAVIRVEGSFRYVLMPLRVS